MEQAFDTNDAVASSDRQQRESFFEAAQTRRVFRNRLCALLVSMDPGVDARPNQWPESSRPVCRRNYYDCDRLRQIRLREFFSRLVHWRVGAEWYLITFATPVLICLIAVAITLCFGWRSHVSGWSIEKLRELPERFLFILLFIALGEEPGWRGFALPHLQIKYSQMMASLILAPVWALWHLPLIGNEFPLPIVVPFLLSLFGGTFTLTWVFNGAKGSVLLPMLFHATINSVGAGLIFPLFSGAALVVLWWIYGFVWLCFGLGALLFWANETCPVTSTFTSNL